MSQNTASSFPVLFLRFAPFLHHLSPRLIATSASHPVDCWVSLSVHAGASVDVLHRAGADPELLLIVEVSPYFPRTFGLGTRKPLPCYGGHR